MNNLMTREDVNCALGCEKNDRLVLTGHDRLHDLPGDFDIVKCQTCGLMRTNPRPTTDSIGFYYPDDYGPYLGTQVKSPDLGSVGGIKNLLRPLVHKIFNTKSTALPSLLPGRLLEVGCASGSFLHRMAGEGWHVEGIEFSDIAAQAAHKLGYQVYAGSLEDAPAPKQAYDLIVGWMVLEHLHDPVGCLKKLHNWAKPGASLALSVPNVGSIEFNVFKEKWYALHLPNHLYHFTPDTLEKVLEAAGWALVKVHHQINLNNLIVSLAYVLEDKGWCKSGRWFRKFAGLGGIWFYLMFPLAWIFSVFKQTGSMTVWARKID
jgi:2-polyprenyl-3-methyl-5-hydroxy-6-metoxy-1,4-benzoquinol methylase